MAKEYNIARSSRVCKVSGEELQPGQDFMATVVEQDGQMVREDYSLPAWEDHKRAAGENALAIWRTRIPEPTEPARKKTFIDDELLINFFQRLDGTEDETQQAFRFVVALVLMRKKKLTYDRARSNGDGPEVWRVRIKGWDETYEMVNPNLDEDRIAEVGEQLGEILEGEL